MGWVSRLGRWVHQLRRQRVLRPVVRVDGSALGASAGLLAEGAPIIEMKGSHAVWLHLSCPCRCGAVLRVNLMRSQFPCWKVMVGAGGRITVDPSVEVAGCGSHFLVRDGRIHWV